MFLLRMGRNRQHIFGAFHVATQSILYSISGPPERPGFAKQIRVGLVHINPGKARIKNKLEKVNATGEAWRSVGPPGVELGSQLNGSLI